MLQFGVAPSKSRRGAHPYLKTSVFIPIVAIAWLYVTLLMAVTEATSTQGTVLGAIFTFLLYGALPIALVVYVMATPARKRARRAREAEEETAAARARIADGTGAAPASGTPASNTPDQGGEPATGGAVTPEGKEP